MKASYFNNFPESFPDPVDNFNKPAIFKLLNVKEEKDPENPTAPPRLLMPSSQDIGLTDTILFEDNDGEKKPIHIAYLKGEQPDGSAIIGYDDILFTIQNRGRVFLDPKIPKHREMYRYMFLCSENRDSPYRNPTIKPIFYLVDYDKEANESIAELSLAREAMDKVEELEASAAKSLYRNLTDKNPEVVSLKIIQSVLLKQAYENPTKVMKTLNASINDVISKVKEAVDVKVLRNDTAKRQFVFVDTKTPLFTYKGLKPSPYKQCAEFLVKNPSVEKNLDIKIQATKI